MPVTERPVEGLEVFGGGARRFFRLGAFVDIPIVLQAVFKRRSAHELPHALRFGAGKRIRLERALDQRDVGEIQRQALGPEDILNHRQEANAAAQPLLQIPTQAAGKELHEGQHTRIERDVDVVVGRPEVLGDRFLCLGRRVRERRHRQKVVNRRRLVLFLGEAVALGKRRQLGGADALDQPVVVLADTRLGPGAPWRFEENVERLVELGACAFQVTKLELGLPGLEMAIGGGNQIFHGIGASAGQAMGNLFNIGHDTGHNLVPQFFPALGIPTIYVAQPYGGSGAAVMTCDRAAQPPARVAMKRSVAVGT